MFKTRNQIFQYEGSPITFSNGGSVMVNATEMAKPFGKLPAGWLRNQQTQEFIKELSNMRNCIYAELVQVNSGSSENGGGTWLHEDVALEFARWLSPKFAIWCNDRIKELLTKGTTSLQSPTNDDALILEAMNVLNKRLEASKRQLQIAESERDHYKQEVEELEPMAEYTKEVLQSDTTYTFTQVANDLGFRSVGAFTKTLHEKKIIFKQSGQWLLTAKYRGNGYTTTRTARYFKSDGTPATSISTVWTEFGRAFLHSLFNNQQTA